MDHVVPVTRVQNEHFLKLDATQANATTARQSKRTTANSTNVHVSSNTLHGRGRKCNTLLHDSTTTSSSNVTQNRCGIPIRGFGFSSATFSSLQVLRASLTSAHVDTVHLPTRMRHHRGFRRRAPLTRNAKILHTIVCIRPNSHTQNCEHSRPMHQRNGCPAMRALGNVRCHGP
jgi:hypothetical protein